LTGDGFNFLVANVSNAVVVELAPAVIAGEIAGDGGVMTAFETFATRKLNPSPVKDTCSFT
jgi:hypothetical protein